MRLRTKVLWSALVVVVGAGVLASVAGAAPVRTRNVIVVLEDSVARPAGIAARHAELLDAHVSFVYRHALEGYAASVPVSELDTLRSLAQVDYVELDKVMRASATQSAAPWGLDRIDQRARPLSGTFTYTNSGSSVTAYIIDTGIRFTHTDFGGRAVTGYDAVDGGPATDCNGHGTHVAGTVGGNTYGVAKSVRLVGVRVLNCSGSGSTSGVIAGVDWVTGDHAAGAPAVANMSLGGGASSSLDSAVTRSINDGVSYAVAAGNGNIIGMAQNACNYSPARVGAAMTIGASDSSDRKASWSNYGNCVDWFGPGVSIKSAYYSSDTATSTLSGTSMATPHVAGVAAQYLQSNPSASPGTVRDALYNLTTKAIVTSSSTANNHLLFTNL